MNGDGQTLVDGSQWANVHGQKYVDRSPLIDVDNATDDTMDAALQIAEKLCNDGGWQQGVTNHLGAL